MAMSIKVIAIALAFGAVSSSANSDLITNKLSATADLNHLPTDSLTKQPMAGSKKPTIDVIKAPHSLNHTSGKAQISLLQRDDEAGDAPSDTPPADANPLPVAPVAGDSSPTGKLLAAMSSESASLPKQSTAAAMEAQLMNLLMGKTSFGATPMGG